MTRKHYPEPYVEYLVYFHSMRDYFECHEVLEEYWKETGVKEKHWIGLIQLAVGLYHQRRGNNKGALRMISKSLTYMGNEIENDLGIDYRGLKLMMQNRLISLRNNEKYKDLNLPLQSEDLINLCIQKSREQGVKWLSPSDMNNTYVLNKHKERDRSEIIRQRELSIQKKKNGGVEVEKEKELYHCENCNHEFWLLTEDTFKKGSICPNNCNRNHQIYLGQTEEEISKRRKKFLETKGVELDIDPEKYEEDERHYEEEYGNRRSGGSGGGDKDHTDMGF